MIETLISILVGMLVLFLASFLIENFIGNEHLAPGPLRIPIFGNLIELAWINRKEPHVAFTKLGEKYGKIFSFQLGSIYSVVINSFDLMEEYLTKSEFSDRYFNGWMGERTDQKRLGVALAKYPAPWHSLRRFSLRTLRDFGFGKSSTMHSIIHAELHELIGELKTSLVEQNGIHTFDNYFNISFLNVVWSMLAGTRYKHDDPKLLKLIKIIRELFLSANMGANVLIAFPEWRNWFPDKTGMSTQRKCYKETNAFFQEFIEERRNVGRYKTSPENLVDEFLLEIDAKQENADDNDVFTDEQLVALMSDFFLAGSETTSNTLSWSILYLLLNPEVQMKLQKEIDSVVPKGTFPGSEHESQLHYVRATIAETHRMASLLPVMVPRAPVENTVCGPYFIPKGTYVMTNIYGMHHDKAYWKDPENFQPERFIDDDGKFKNDPRLKPFGFGKRMCLGEPVASMSLIHFLTVLMQNFTFHPVPNEQRPSVNPVVGITNGPQTFRALITLR